jgi:hypothetical protein
LWGHWIRVRYETSENPRLRAIAIISLRSPPNIASKKRNCMRSMSGHLGCRSAC